jgi:hypothetical protein
MANRYSNIEILSGSSIADPRYYKNAIYPEVEPSENDTYIITTSDDRLDLLAYDFFGDPKLWWIIAAANNFPGNSMYVTNGVQVRIPGDYIKIVNDFVQINKLR